MENDGKNRYRVVNITKPDSQVDNLNSQAEVLKKILLKSAVLALAVTAAGLYSSASEVSQIEPLFVALCGGSGLSVALAIEAVEEIIKGVSKKIVGEATSELKAQIAESEAQIAELKEKVAALEQENNSRPKGRR